MQNCVAFKHCNLMFCNMQVVFQIIGISSTPPWLQSHMLASNPSAHSHAHSYTHAQTHTQTHSHTHTHVQAIIQRRPRTPMQMNCIRSTSDSEHTRKMFAAFAHAPAMRPGFTSGPSNSTKCLRSSKLAAC